MKEELKRNQSASTCENAGRYKKHPMRIAARVKIRESQTLQQDLTEHIRKIMSFSLADKFYKDLPQESIDKFKDESFINPKKIEISPGLSRIKQHYIQEYQKRFVVEGIQEIHNDQHAVQNILYSGLSASAQASAKWNSIQAMRRMQAERPQCPDFHEYPLDKKTFQEIQSTKAKTHKRQRAVSEHQDVSEKLILDRSRSLKKYLVSLVKSNKTFTEIYGQRKGEYDLILDYATKEKIDMRQADDDIQFINSRKVIKEKKQYQSNVEIKRLQRRKYIDDDDVYGVKPNRIQPTRIILKDNNKSNQ